MASEVFEAQVALLVRILPYVATETCFALKGGVDLKYTEETFAGFYLTHFLPTRFAGDTRSQQCLRLTAGGTS
jgi:hypothetical protein